MEWHLAQVNIGRLRAPIDDPLIAEFKDALDQINALADCSPGFVWRLQTAEGNATALHPVEDDELVAINMSVWESVEALADYVYRSDHTAFYAGDVSGSSATARRTSCCGGSPPDTSRRSTRRSPASPTSRRTDPPKRPLRLPSDSRRPVQVSSPSSTSETPARPDGGQI